MDRWNGTVDCFQEFSEVDEFIEAVLAVCKQHGFSISHEDGQGAFEIHKGLDENDYKWLRDAHYYSPEGE